ncbi:42159_t:CDS:1, partial [Gigaspora margarita]
QLIGAGGLDFRLVTNEQVGVISKWVINKAGVMDEWVGNRY